MKNKIEETVVVRAEAIHCSVTPLTCYLVGPGARPCSPVLLAWVPTKRDLEILVSVP